jgi:hypothetical protein
MSLSRLLLASSIVLFSGTSFAETCHFTNVNNVIEPSAQHDKGSICNSQHVQDYESLFYYTGPKAACNDNKTVYCAKVEKYRVNVDVEKPNLASVIGRESKVALDDQYWAKAFNYCGLDYKAINERYCAKLASTSNSSNDHAEKNCKPEHLNKLAERVCGGGRSYSAENASHSAWCGKNFKKADVRSKKSAKEAPVKEAYDNSSACSPREISFASSSSPSSSSSSSSSGSSAPTSNDAPSAPAPSAPAGVDDALNKAKKIKDLFNF